MAKFNRHKNELSLGLSPLAYVGSADYNASAQSFWAERAPTDRDYYGYLVGDIWIDQSKYAPGPPEVNPEVWILVYLRPNKTAKWIRFYGGAGQLETLTADTGTNPVPPNATDTIFVKGTAPIVTRGVAVNNQVWIETDGTVATTFRTDAGDAIPAAGILNVLGGAFINTEGTGNTVTIKLDTNVISTITTDNGVATPVNNNINFTDGENTNTHALDDDMWVNLNRVIRWPDTNAAGDEGVIYLGSTCTGTECTGGTRFMHNYGTDNTFLGDAAGNFTMDGTVTACTGIGSSALTSIDTNSDYNVAVGDDALASLTEGSGCTAVGSGAGSSLVTTTTAGITAIGYDALASFTSSIYPSTAVGNRALHVATSGGNTAIGGSCMFDLTDSTSNTGLGSSALQQITTGSNNNIAIGASSCESVADINNSIVIGASALNGVSAVGPYTNCTLVGMQSLKSSDDGEYITALGYKAAFGLTGSRSSDILIGNEGSAADDNTIRIGNHGAAANQQNRCFIAGIRGITTGVADAIPVLIDSSHQLGTASSSIRYKENVKDLGDESARIYDLRPVTFNYKTDETKSKHYGLIAEEVEKVLRRLVVFDPESGQCETVKYHEMPVLLLNELIKQNKKISELEARLSKLEGRQ